MTYQIDDLVMIDGAWVQHTRDATLEEAAEIDARKTALPTRGEYQAAVQGLLDSAARAKNYDDIVSACSYAGAPNPFQAEGQAFLTWRGNVWASCYQILAEVQAGQRPQPTMQELLAGLPSFEL